MKITVGILQALISKRVADRDSLNSQIERCLKFAHEDPNFEILDAMNPIIEALARTEKEIEVIQGLHARVFLKEAADELSKNIETKKTE
jgi:hypothetical protein